MTDMSQLFNFEVDALIPLFSIFGLFFALELAKLGRNQLGHFKRLLLAHTPLLQPLIYFTTKSTSTYSERLMQALTLKVKIESYKAIDALKKAQKEGMPEDESKDGETQSQKLLEKFSKTLDEALSKKEKEIMTV